MNLFEIKGCYRKLNSVGVVHHEMPSIELSIHYRPEAIENSELNYSITSFATHKNLLSSLCRLVDGGTAVDHAPAWTSFSMKHWANLNLFNFGIVHWTENYIGIRLYSDGEPNELNRLHRSLSRATQAFDVSRLYSNRFGLISILRMRHAIEHTRRMGQLYVVDPYTVALIDKL